MKSSFGFLAVVFSAVVSTVAGAQTDPGSTGSNGQPGLQAGGLTPPPPEGENAESAKTEENLAEADNEDSGRGLEFVYLNVEGGVENLGLQTLHANGLVPTNVATSATGPVFGAGVGLRLLFLTVGPRFRLAHFSQYDLWTLGAEVGLHIPLGSLEPYFVLGGGYASLGAFNADDFGPSSNDVAVRGYDIRAGGGLDYYVTPVFSIGANVTGDILGLARPGVVQSLQSGTGTVTKNGADTVLAVDGSSLGLGVTGTIVLGLHF